VSIILDDRIADRYAFVTDVGSRVVTRRRNELTDDILTLVAEGTAEGIIRSGALQALSPVLRVEKINRSLALFGVTLRFQYSKEIGFVPILYGPKSPNRTPPGGV
jgi:hypothetical protein